MSDGSGGIRVLPMSVGLLRPNQADKRRFRLRKQASTKLQVWRQIPPFPVLLQTLNSAFVNPRPVEAGHRGLA